MLKPVLYYEDDGAGRGRITAIAPTELREEDRKSSWTVMRITESEWRLLMEQEIHSNWYVELDAINDLHVLKTTQTAQQDHPSVGLIQMGEAKTDIDDPELIIEQTDGEVYLVAPDMPIRGKVDFWLTAEQDQAVVFDHVQIELQKFATEQRLPMFPACSDRTTIYYVGRVQKVRDARNV